MYGDEMNSYQQPQGNYGQQWQGDYGQQPQGNYGQQPPQMKPVGNGLGIASLVLGIVSLVLFCTCVNIVTGILAIIFGIVQLNKGGNKGMPIAGIITSALSIAACVIYWIAVAGTAASYEDLYSNPSYYMEEYYENLDYEGNISL